MTRYMYDGVNPPAVHSNFPNPDMVAGYINGLYAWSSAHWDLFPHATHVTISINAHTPAMVLDVEPGDATPSEAEGWITLAKEHGIYRPTIYCNLSTVPAVRQGTGKYVLGRDYDLWVADYDNSTKQVYSGAAAKQYKTAANYDASIVYDDGWPHVGAPAPAAPKVPAKLSQTATDAFTDFGWGAVSGAIEYDFQLMEGSVQVFRKSFLDTHAERIPTNPSTAYQWRVASIMNGGGWSAWQKFTTPKPSAPPTVPPATYQYAAPTGLTARGGHTSFAASWTAPQHGTYVAPEYTVYVYDVTHAAPSNDNEVPTYPRTVTTTTFSGGSLTKGNTYEVHVVAHGPNGLNTRPYTYASARFTCS